MANQPELIAIIGTGVIGAIGLAPDLSGRRMSYAELA
jgi:hypothetical protein